MNILKLILISIVAIPLLVTKTFADINANGTHEASPSSDAASQSTQPNNGAASQSYGSAAVSQPSNSAANDTSITNYIRSTISTNASVAKLNISTASQNGKVTLIGNAYNNMELRTLVEIASSAPGVTDVDTSKLTVNNIPASNDVVITAKIEGAYIREKLYGDKAIANPIQVETNNGIVTLSGSVESQNQADKAIIIAKSVNGVVKINPKLIVTEEKNSKS